MPISPLYTWTQDEHHIDLVITIKHQKLNQDTVQLKVSPHVLQLWAPQHLLIIDLYDTITWDYRIEYHQSRACIDVRLNKQTPGIWPQLQHTAPHAQLLARRAASLQQWESHQQQLSSQRLTQRTSHAQHVREQGWAVGSRERDALTSIKAQERVVATEDLRTWTENVKEKKLQDEEEEEDDNRINPASMVIQAVTSPSAAASAAASTSTSTSITPHPAVDEITRTLPPPRRHNTIKVSFTAQSSSAPARADDDDVGEIKLDKKTPTTTSDDARHMMEQTPLHLKEKGDTLFHQNEWHGAYHAYTDVINKLHDTKDITLLCRTLANRAAVSMKLAIPMGTHVIQPCMDPSIIPTTSTSSHLITSTTLATWSQQYIHWQDVIHEVEECETKMNGIQMNEQEKIDFAIKLHLRAATAASSLCDHKTVIRHTSQLLDILSKTSTSITSHEDVQTLHDRHKTYQHAYDASEYLTYHHDGETATSHGKHDKAIQAYTHALAINPYRLITWINRGNVYATMGYTHECIADVCYALSLIERIEKGQIHITSTSTSTPDWFIQQSQQIAHTPTRDLIRSRLYARRGACLYICGNLHLSYRDYDMAYQYDSNPSLAADRARLYYEWQRDVMLQRARSAYHTSKWLQGVKLYTDVITHHTTTCPDIPDRSYLAALLIDRAACYLQASEYDECIADITRALDIDSTSIHTRIALIRRGTAYIWQGQSEKGCVDYMEALRLNSLAQEKWNEDEIQQVQHDLQMIRGQSH